MARVLQVVEPRTGGVAVHVGHLGLELGGHGHVVEVATPADSTIVPELADAGVPVHAVGFQRGYGRPDRDAAGLRRLIALMRGRRYDLVHCHASKAGALGRVAARIAGVPAVYTPHCFGWVGDVPLSRKVFSTAVEWLLGRTASAAVVCVCDAERRWARRRRIAPERRLWRIYLGVEDCARPPEPDPRLVALRGDGVLAAAVSVLREQKALDVLVDAAPSVLARVPQARVAVVGNGPLRASLEERVRALGLDAEARFALLDFAGPPSRYLQSLDLFVLPSAWEAMPLSIMEALACGVPQVATDVGGTREAVDDATGRVVPPRSPTALAEAIVALLADEPARAEMGRASRRRYQERAFNIPRMVADTARLYEAVLEEAG